MEAIITSAITGFLFGSIVGHLTTLDIIPQLEKTDKKNGVKPKLWFEPHKNLNAALIQLRRKAEVKDDMASARQRNLQLQMNPHFIFNALTGIHMLMLRGDKADALRAIRKFKGLLIKSWDNAIDNPKKLSASTLREEINFLTDYVELEKYEI